MALAERLLALLENDGFVRLRRRSRSWEVWVRNDVIHVLVGPTLENVVAQAESVLAGRAP